MITETSPYADLIGNGASCLMQASCQSLPSGLRVMLFGTMQGSFLDDSTSCFELLLEPSAIETIFQQGSAPAIESMSQSGGERPSTEEKFSAPCYSQP